MSGAVPNRGAGRFTPGQREEQRIKALKLWMEGDTYRVIGRKLGVDHMTAYRRVQAAIDAMRPHADFDKYRAKQLAELEMSRRPMRVVIATWTAGDCIDDAVKAIGALLKIQEREAKLLGLDRVPTPFDDLAGMSDEELETLVAGWADELANTATADS